MKRHSHPPRRATSFAERLRTQSRKLTGPRRAILEEVRRNFTAASFEAVERDGAFQPRGDA